MKSIINKFRDFISISTFVKIVVILIIVVGTLLPSLFDPENADWKKVGFNFILSLLIAMGAFISQMVASKNKAMKKEEYKESKKNHVDQIKEIRRKKLSHIHGLYVKDENKKNKLEYVTEAFSQFEIPIDYYTMDQELVKVALRKNQITKEQYSVIKICRTGKIQYDRYDVGDLTTTQILKKGRNSNKSQQASITASNLIGKISWMLAFSIIWGMFVWDESKGMASLSNGQAWIDLGGRLFTFGGGLYCGDHTGKEIIADEIRLFDKFYNFNCKFVQDFETGIWKPSEEAVSENIVDYLMKLQAEEETAENKAESDVEIEEIELTAEQIAQLKGGQ